MAAAGELVRGPDSCIWRDNVQSLKPKLLALRQDIAEHGYDVIVLSETWMRPTAPNRLVPIPGYQLVGETDPTTGDTAVWL